MPTTHSAQPPMVPAKSRLDAALHEVRQTGQWLADQTGMTKHQVSRFRNGLRPSHDAQERIARVLSREMKRRAKRNGNDPRTVTPEELWP
jgi:transcriptional regulator with XRE-family HTH domain